MLVILTDWFVWDGSFYPSPFLGFLCSEPIIVAFVSSEKYLDGLSLVIEDTEAAGQPHPWAEISRQRAERSDLREPQTTYRQFHQYQQLPQEEVCTRASAGDHTVRLTPFPHIWRINLILRQA